MHYFILPTKDLSKLFFFMQESLSMQTTRGNWTKKNYCEIMLFAYAEFTS